MSATQIRVNAINLVVVASTDQDRSIEFYEQVLGFEKRADIPFGNEYRWVEVYPPSGTTGIALAPPQHEDQVGVQTGISLVPTDRSLLLTSAGVVAFRAVLEGREKPSHPRVANCQRCLRQCQRLLRKFCKGLRVRETAHMYDQRIEARPLFGRKNAGDGAVVRRVRTKPVNGFGGKGDQSAAAQDRSPPHNGSGIRELNFW